MLTHYDLLAQQWVLSLRCSGHLKKGHCVFFQNCLKKVQSIFQKEKIKVVQKQVWFPNMDIVAANAILDKITTQYSWSHGQIVKISTKKFNFQLLCPLKNKNPSYGSKVMAISNKKKMFPRLSVCWSFVLPDTLVSG